MEECNNSRTTAARAAARAAIKAAGITDEESYYCTRPRLAALLEDLNCRITPTRNRMNPDLHAWTVVLDETSAAAIAEYFDVVGKPVPVSVQNFLDR